MSETFFDTWKDRVHKITSYIARDYPNVEAEDLQQDLYTLILSRRWTNPDDDSVVIILKRVAQWKAMQYRTQQIAGTSQYCYRPSEVRKILELVFDYNDWPRRSVPTKTYEDGGETPQWGLFNSEIEGVETEGVYNRLPHVDRHEDDGPIMVGGVSGPVVDWEDKLTAFSDIKQAWKRLPEEHKKSIFKRYALKWMPDRKSAEERRLERAVNRLVAILNGGSV